jgi:phosphatidylserine/phosphatidylglycerophosphate/cardiolipin synthase-like enzyme
VSRANPRRGAAWVLIAVAAVLLLAGVLVALVLFNRRAPGPVATAPPAASAGSPVAAASDAWQVAFTSPVSPPDNDPTKHHGSLDDRLVALMARATRTLDVADYDFDLADVAQAMAGAARRGARVRMVTDSDTLDNTKDAAVQAAFKTLRDAAIPIVPDNRPAIMHNKFTVVDGEWVEMGSWNYTDGDTYHLNNNMAIWHSKELADNYTTEFEKMFVQKKFGASKPKGVPHPTLEVGGGGAHHRQDQPGTAEDPLPGVQLQPRRPGPGDAGPPQGGRGGAGGLRDDRLEHPVQRVRHDEAGRAGCLPGR